MSLFPATSIDQRLDARRWLTLAVASLAASGLFPPLLVLVRSRSAGENIPFEQYFHMAITVHVNLSVLVWFLAVAGVLWSLIHPKRPLLSAFSFWTMAAGTLALALSPAAGGEALMNDYIPVLYNPLFFLSLGLILAGLICKLFALASSLPELTESPLKVGIASAGLIAFLSLISFLLSQQGLAPDAPRDYAYFETLFWGGGHILQFTHTQLMLVAWIVLAASAGLKLRLSGAALKALFAIGVFAALAAFYPYVAYNLDDPAHMRFFTEHMIALGGFAPALLTVAIAAAAMRGLDPGSSASRSALISSMFMFLLGGVLGLFISGANTVIPAHYHGSIVAVTLAFMGTAYLLLPQIGGSPVPARWATAQPLIFAAGQAMHAIGLALGGGHGAARKSTDSLDALSAVFFAKHLIRWGGLLAVVGGVLFILLCARSLRRPVQP